MVVVLKKLTYGALLSPSASSEEFREGVIRCFRAMLLGLHPCSDNSCSCKQSTGLPALLTSRSLQAPQCLDYDSKPQECLLLFIQSQTASAAVGHWLSLLLKAADTEASRGFRGSAKLRIESFLTLRVLVAKVGTADALAFFLPGVVSHIAKILHLSKSMISGALGNVEAYDHAIRGLAEFLMIVLQDDANLSAIDKSKLHSNKTVSTQLVLEELRQLRSKVQSQSDIAPKDFSDEAPKEVSASFGFKEKGNMAFGNMMGSLNVIRTKEWIDKTSAHVNKLLCATFPHICVHPAKKIRQGVLAAIRGLLSNCSCTLKGSRLVLLECLCVLVCDDFDEVSEGAQEFLENLFSSSRKQSVEHDFAEIFRRLIEKLPQVVLGSDELLALSHAQQLLVLIYYSGPQFVLDHLLGSPVAAARFFDTFAVCLGQNSVFAGSLDKLILTKRTSMGYLQSVTELKANVTFTNQDDAQNKNIQYSLDGVQREYELPRMPPWFRTGSQKLYQTLAKILRLVGLSILKGLKSAAGLTVITDIQLGPLRNLVSEVRRKEYSKETWQSWYTRTGSGQLLRQASTSACILNEIIFGISDQSIDVFTRMFRKHMLKGDDKQENNCWKVCLDKATRNHLIDCIGTVLHEYQSPEVWDIPIEHKNLILQSDDEAEEISLHLFNDASMLHQVIIEGIGIFNLCLKQEFATSGYLHSSLYLLLENLIHSNYQIRSATDAVLRVISATSGYPTVGHLVVANSDYVIDSLCRQLRHLDLNPHVPNVLAAMLGYIRVAHKILPLLEEPMRAVSQELEILGRHQHPNLTVPFLKAVSEISKATKHEAFSMPSKLASFSRHIKSKMADMEKKLEENLRKSSMSHCNDVSDISAMESDDKYDEQWEDVVFKLKDSKRYRRTVGSIASSCLTAATPILSSCKESACLLALEIIEDGTAALEKVEEAYKLERESEETLLQAIQLCSLYHLQDTLNAVEEGNDENRLLPAMNKIWPFLVVCVQHKNQVAVKRCLGVVSSVVQICGGDFFSRRFYKDGSNFWKLLTTSPFYKKPISKEGPHLKLPYRSTSVSSEDSMAESSSIKIQVAVLNMIADLSANKRSASSLEAVFKRVSGLVVGIACSGVIGLRDAAVNALKGLASMDSDLIWVLLADVYYSLKKKEMPLPPTSDLPEIGQILPPPLTPKGYLYVQYGGQSYGFTIDFSSVEFVFKKLQSEVFRWQTCRDRKSVV